QPGTANSAVRVGVVSAIGGPIKWMDLTGAPQTSYIARMEWAGNSDELVIQHLNRLQNANDLVLAKANTGRVQKILHDEDTAWVEVVDDLRWLPSGKEFLWVSERDGWRHVYGVPRPGKDVRLITPGDFDEVSVEEVDPEGKWIFYIASPENSTQRYLYRSRLDGQGNSERLSPASAPGTHRYQIAPNCQWAFHTYSTFDSPPVIDLVHLPEHSVSRVLEDNHDLREKAKPLIPAPAEFFHVGVGEGVTLDAWMIKPPQFDPSKKYPLLVFVYGEPAAQTVLDAWDGPGMIFHRALANE